ncbi:putative basic proline-rich protein-like [Iris pallida]|uniref:Basic proline-rich protein-like n=1 Tax=Iris pallida TaxID=29817 RepID=A0AAX6EKQ9_IRIPA|nr:putative basic proline-rich protein-like [Iris pallida]KAJ6804521.1 putative basic proline-rich protein-like [Iris pallida]
MTKSLNLSTVPSASASASASTPNQHPTPVRQPLPTQIDTTTTSLVHHNHLRLSVIHPISTTRRLPPSDETTKTKSIER